ncbi:MAG: hypothetical protein ACFFB0_03840 [Promethearchaeota archaeon]
MYFSFKKDTINNIVGFGALFLVFTHILLFLLLMNQDIELRSSIMPLWLLSLGIPLLVVLFLLIISTGIVQVYKRVLNKDFSNFSDKFELKQKNLSKAKKDTFRKLHHVLIFIGLFIVWYIGLYVVQFYTGSSAGMIPEENNMLLLYLQILDEQNSIAEVMYALGWFYYLLFFFFYTICLIMITNEYSRKSRFFSFPFTFFPNLYLTKEEKDNYGTYLYFAIGHLFVAFICPPMIFFAILGISSIADLMTSQIGIRYGTHHISWNKEKTWEGSIAGIFSTYIICIFFVGHFWAMIFSITFLIFDIFTRKPINISDNLLIPIGCGLLYIFIRFFFKLDFYTIILAWI